MIVRQLFAMENFSFITLEQKWTLAAYLDPLRYLACTRILMCPAQILQ